MTPCPGPWRLDQAADSFKRVLGENEVVVWKWGSTIISLETGARPETIDRVAKAVRTLPSKPKLIVDNR